MSILITSALSVQAYQFKNKLTDQQVLLGDYRDVPEFMLTQGTLLKLPNPQSPAYAHEMLTFCLDKGVNVIYVLEAVEAQELLNSKQLFNEYGIDVQPVVNEV